jgi:hypothetical protein
MSKILNSPLPNQELRLSLPKWIAWYVYMDLFVVAVSQAVPSEFKHAKFPRQQFRQFNKLTTASL